MKGINILVSVLECIKFHYSINKMKEAVNLVQSPGGVGESNHCETTHSESSLEAVFFPLHHLLLLLFLYK